MAKRIKPNKKRALLKAQGKDWKQVRPATPVAEPAKAPKKEVKTEVAVDETAIFEGLTAARQTALKEAGFASAQDFANATEKDVLAVKGIGPAAVKQLKENGVSFKVDND